MTRVLIPHLDDVGCARGSIAAFDELTQRGLVTSGSVIVPTKHFPDVVELVRRRPDLDVGVHLALTSESVSHRWSPLTDGAGLRDGSGYMWARTSQLRDEASPLVVAAELRAQVDTALAAGLRISHLDHHMGASLAPEYLEVTVELAEHYGIPVLLPGDLESYYADVGIDAAAPGVREVRADLAAKDLLVADHFSMGYNERHRPCREVYEELIADAPPGVTYLSLHCSVPGDIAEVHPGSAGWRVAEYELFRDPAFIAWVETWDGEIATTRTSGKRRSTGRG